MNSPGIVTFNFNTNEISFGGPSKPSKNEIPNYPQSRPVRRRAIASSENCHRRDVKTIVSSRPSRQAMNDRAQQRQQQHRADRMEGVRGPMTRVAIDPTQEKLRHRRKSEIELIQTEESYVQSLREFNQIFLQPIKDMKWKHKSSKGKMKKNKTGFLTIEQSADTLFGGMISILKANEEFQARLTPCLDEDLGSDKIARVFLDMIPWISPLYKDYIHNYSKLCEQLNNEMAQNEQFKTFLDNQIYSTENVQKLGIFSFLIMPVQRLPRYRLLLEAMIKNTLDNNDLLNLNKALNKICYVSDNINKTIIAEENKLKILAVEKQFVDMLDMELLNRNGNKAEKRCLITQKDCLTNEEPGKIFLLNDTILLAKYCVQKKKSKNSTRKLNQIVMSDLVVTFLSPHPFLDTAFSVSTSQGVVSIGLKTVEERKALYFEIENCIDKLISSSLSCKRRRDAVKLEKRMIGFEVTERAETVFIKSGEKMSMGEYASQGMSYTEMMLKQAGLPTYSELSKMKGREHSKSRKTSTIKSMKEKAKKILRPSTSRHRYRAPLKDVN